MKLVVGLGNPGTRYERTRHNLGFWVVDELARRAGIDMTRQKFNAYVGNGTIAGQRTTLLKPTTFMNLSGQAVQAAMAFHKLPLDDLLVVSDDLDLPVGRLRVRASGSSGGHRGLEDIIRALGSDAFARVRVGIGRSEHADAVGHVLTEFTDGEESVVLTQVVGRAADAVECWASEGVTAAMNEFNRAGRRSGGGGSEATSEGAGS